MQIHIKTLTARTVTIEVDYKETILSVKQKLQLKEPSYTSPEEIRMIWAGKQLQNHLTLEYYGITKESTLHIVLNLRGNGDLLNNHILLTNIQNDDVIDPNFNFKFTFDIAVLCIDQIHPLVTITLEEPISLDPVVPTSSGAPQLTKVFDVESSYIFDKSTRSLSIHPLINMPFGCKGTIQLNHKAFVMISGVSHFANKIRFTVKDMPCITITTSSSESPDIKLKLEILPSLVGSFEKLRKKISMHHGISHDYHISKIDVLSGDILVRIENDTDMGNLKDGDCVYFDIEKTVYEYDFEEY